MFFTRFLAAQYVISPQWLENADMILGSACSSYHPLMVAICGRVPEPNTHHEEHNHEVKRYLYLESILNLFVGKCYMKLSSIHKTTMFTIETPCNTYNVMHLQLRLPTCAFHVTDLLTQHTYMQTAVRKPVLRRSMRKV